MRPLTAASTAFFAIWLLCACPEAKPAARGEHTEAVMSSPQMKRSAPEGARSVTLATSDGWQIAGWYWGPSRQALADGAKAPGIILLHQRGRDKSSWGDFSAQLTRQGYAVIAIDLRGHGESRGPGGRRISVDDLENKDYAEMLNDLAAADMFLQEQSEVNADRIGIIGASIGANLAVMYLAGDRRVRTAVCLSPGLDYRGLKPLDFMEAVDKRPLYLIATKGDEYSARSASELSHAGTPEGPKSLRLLEGKEHGTDMLAAHEGLDKTIASGWLLNYLPPKR
jgi:dienelactone hydrolase